METRTSETMAHANVVALLSKMGIRPTITRHPPVRTCEEADKYVDEPEFGIKSVILQTKTVGLVVCVVPGNRRIDMAAVKTMTDGKTASFAKAETACAAAGCEPWSVPPFWHAERMAILVDEALADFPKAYFNPGTNTETYEIGGPEFVRVLKSENARFWAIAKTPQTLHS